MPAYDRPEGRAGGVAIEGTGLRQGWTGEGKPKARRQWAPTWPGRTVKADRAWQSG